MELGLCSYYVQLLSICTLNKYLQRNIFWFLIKLNKSTVTIFLIFPLNDIHLLVYVCKKTYFLPAMYFYDVERIYIPHPLDWDVSYRSSEGLTAPGTMGPP